KGRMAGDVLEVCIGAKQLRSDVEARLGDDTVHRSAYGNTPATQRTVQAGRSHVTVHGRMNDRQADQDLPGPLESGIGPESLENLRDDDRNHRQVLFILESGVEARRMRGPDTA